MTISSPPFSMSSSSSQDCDQSNDQSFEAKSSCREPLNVTRKPAIRNGIVTKKFLESNDNNFWRKHGLEKRKQLLEDDEKSGGSSFIIHEHTNIKRYFEIANRVHEQFRSAYEEDKNHEDTYLMGNRLVKFLCEVLPTHNQYNSSDVARLRIKSQNHLAQVRIDIENVALKIDRFCYYENLHLEKQDRTHSPIEEKSSEFGTNMASSSKPGQKRVTFDLRPLQLDQPNENTLGVKDFNYDASSSHIFPFDPHDSSSSEDVPDMSFSSGSSSESHGNSSFDSYKHNSSKKTEMNFDAKESPFRTESSFQDSEDAWEPFGDWKNENAFERFENKSEKSNTMFTDLNSFKDCQAYENECNSEEYTPETNNSLEQTQLHSVDEVNISSNNLANTEFISYAEEYESFNEISDEYCEENPDDDDESDINPKDDDMDAYAQDHNDFNTPDDSTGSGYSYYEDTYSDYEDTQDLSFVEKIALENTSHSIDRLHEVDGDDSDAEDSWAQEDYDDSSDHDSEYQSSQSTFDMMMSKEGEAYTDSDYSDDDSSSNPTSLTDDDEDEHDEFVKDVSDEFAEFDSRSGGEKTTSTAETEALTVEEYSDDEYSAPDYNLEEQTGILGIARRDGYVPTLNDVPIGYNVNSHIAFNHRTETGAKKIDYLESRLKSLVNTRKQMASTSRNDLSSQKDNDVKVPESNTKSTGKQVTNDEETFHKKPPLSPCRKFEDFSSEPVADLPSLSRTLKQKESRFVENIRSNSVDQSNLDASRSSSINASNRPDRQSKNLHPCTVFSRSPNITKSNHSCSPSGLSMARKKSMI